MLFVRNPTGVSHSPDEHAGTADCLAGVDALADALELLLRPATPATPRPRWHRDLPPARHLPARARLAARPSGAGEVRPTSPSRSPTAALTVDDARDPRLARRRSGCPG